METAKDLARCTERDPPTNVEWVRRFLKRTKLDCFENVQLRVFAKRRAIEEEVICDWFDLFKKICEKRGIKRENIYSFDEISIQIGEIPKNMSILLMTRNRICNRELQQGNGYSN